MPQRAPQAPEGPQAYLRALRDPGRNLKERYRNDPLALAERLGLKLPKKPVLVMIELGVLSEEQATEKYGEVRPGLREMVLDVCEGRERSVVAVANRGGGKSFGVSFIEFFLWMILDYDALNLGGSELQADQVYQYLLGYIESDPFWLTLLKGDPMKERTYTKEDSWVRVLTASQKSVRSPHAGGFRKGKMRGGVLVIDEEAEASKDIVESALPTINTARPSVSVRCSTFHNLEGSFQEVVDHHEEMGYRLYRWDIFDVAERCDCVDECQSSEKCFREDHFEDYLDPETDEIAQKLVHRAYCGGRAMYADGWIPMEEIETLWKRMRRNHNRWEVEAMGSRPSSAGFVVNDLNRFAENVVDTPANQLYMKGANLGIYVDWGTVAGGIEVWQTQVGGRHVLLECDLMIDNNRTIMLGKILEYVAKYKRDLIEVACDIGGGGNYMNESLRSEHRLPVRDVNFQEEKEAAVAAINVFNDHGDLVIPAQFEDFHHQIRNWKRKNGRIQKGDDHLCDTAVCYFSRFIEELGLQGIRIAPRTFSPNPDVVDHTMMPRVVGGSKSNRPPARRLPMVRSFGPSGSRRR